MKKASTVHSEELIRKRLLILKDMPGRSLEAEKAGRIRFLREVASLRRKYSYDHIEKLIRKRLLILKDMPGRSLEAEKAGRTRFLLEVASLRRDYTYRQNLWGIFKSFVSGRHARLAFSTAAAVCMVLALLLVSGGTVVFASQSSQPNQILYPVKLLSEDVRLGLAANSESQFQLNMEFAERRLDEIDKLDQTGQDAGVQVTDRLQNELNSAIDSAASLDNTGVIKTMKNLQANLLRHKDHLIKLQSLANPNAMAKYTRVVKILEQKVSLAEQGIKDPQSIHELLAQQKKQDEEPAGDTPTPTAGMHNVEEGTNTPAMAAIQTGTNTPEDTNTPTETFTSSPIPTVTDTQTPSNLPSDTPTSAETVVLTDTLTPTPTSTETDVPTDTLTPTPTDQDTATDTLTPTDTLTSTLTETPTPTNTEPATDTLTPIYQPLNGDNTETPTLTPTFTDDR
jgi:hypothetical protein